MVFLEDLLLVLVSVYDLIWIIAIILVAGFTGVIIVIKNRSNPESAQEKLEHNKEMKGKTLEEYKKDYLAKKEIKERDEELFLQIQKKLNYFMKKKGYSLSEAVGVVAEDYNKRGIYLTVDPSGTEFKISGNLLENFTVQKPAERKESESNFCESCGKSLKPTAKFCGSCGNQV
jgi:hypothetical protein